MVSRSLAGSQGGTTGQPDLWVVFEGVKKVFLGIDLDAFSQRRHHTGMHRFVDRHRPLSQPGDSPQEFASVGVDLGVSVLRGLPDDPHVDAVALTDGLTERCALCILRGERTKASGESPLTKWEELGSALGGLFRSTTHA